jgi:hypothetical protein
VGDAGELVESLVRQRDADLGERVA